MSHSSTPPTVLWQLRRGSDRLTSSVRLTPRGLRLQQSLNGNAPFFERTFETFDELFAWDEEDRRDCLAEGWEADPYQQRADKSVS